MTYFHLGNLGKTFYITYITLADHISVYTWEFVVTGFDYVNKFIKILLSQNFVIFKSGVKVFGDKWQARFFLS